MTLAAPLIVGIGSDLLSSFYAKMGKNVLNYEELAVMLIFRIAFFVLISRLPLLLAGIITGSSIGSTGGLFFLYPFSRNSRTARSRTSGEYLELTQKV